MDWKTCITERRSIRNFKDMEIDNSVFEELITLSSHAPSWKNSQSVRYVIIKDKTLIKRISKEGVLDFEFNQKTILKAPALVLVCTLKERSGYNRDGSFSTTKETHWESFDSGVATQTLVLAAHGLGLASVIMGIFDEEKIKELVKIDDNLKVSALVALGYANEEVEMPKRKALEDLYTTR